MLTVVQIMAWRLTGDKPLSEPVLTPIFCITWPQWIKKFTIIGCITHCNDMKPRYYSSSGFYNDKSNPFKIYLKLKYCMMFVYCYFLMWRNILKFCTKHGNHIAMPTAKYQVCSTKMVEQDLGCLVMTLEADTVLRMMSFVVMQTPIVNMPPHNLYQ